MNYLNSLSSKVYPLCPLLVIYKFDRGQLLVFLRFLATMSSCWEIERITVAVKPLFFPTTPGYSRVVCAICFRVNIRDHPESEFHSRFSPPDKIQFSWMKRKHRERAKKKIRGKTSSAKGRWLLRTLRSCPVSFIYIYLYIYLTLERYRAKKISASIHYRCFLFILHDSYCSFMFPNHREIII